MDGVVEKVSEGDVLRLMVGLRLKVGEALGDAVETTEGVQLAVGEREAVGLGLPGRETVREPERLQVVVWEGEWEALGGEAVRVGLVDGDRVVAGLDGKARWGGGSNQHPPQHTGKKNSFAEGTKRKI